MLSPWYMHHNYFTPDDFAFDHTGCAEQVVPCGRGTWADSVERMVVVWWFGEFRWAQQVRIVIYIYIYNIYIYIIYYIYMDKLYEPHLIHQLKNVSQSDETHHSSIEKNIAICDRINKPWSSLRRHWIDAAEVFRLVRYRHLPSGKLT